MTEEVLAAHGVVGRDDPAAAAVPLAALVGLARSWRCGVGDRESAIRRACQSGGIIDDVPGNRLHIHGGEDGAFHRGALRQCADAAFDLDAGLVDGRGQHAELVVAVARGPHGEVTFSELP